MSNSNLLASDSVDTWFPSMNTLIKVSSSAANSSRRIASSSSGTWTGSSASAHPKKARTAREAMLIVGNSDRPPRNMVLTSSGRRSSRCPDPAGQGRHPGGVLPYVRRAVLTSAPYVMTIAERGAQVQMIRTCRRGLRRILSMNPSPGATIRIYMVGGTSCGHTRPGLSYMVASGRVRRERWGLYPDSIHVTVLRDRRWYSAPEEVSVHTTVRPLGPDTVRRRGVRVTRPERAIADSADDMRRPTPVLAGLPLRGTPMALTGSRPNTRRLANAK